MTQPIALNEHERKELSVMLSSDVFQKANQILELNEPTVFTLGLSSEAKVNIFHEIKGYRMRNIILESLVNPPEPKKAYLDPDIN